MTTRDPAGPVRYRPRLRRRLMFAFAGYTLLVGTLLGALSMMFVYAVEDEFFAAALRTEAERQQTHLARHGEWTQPAQHFVRLYPRAEGLPADLAVRFSARPQGREFEGDDGRYYHVHELAHDGTVLVAEVSAQLVVRPLRDTLLLWLIGAGGLATAASLLLAWWLAGRTSAPLGRLAQRIADGSPDALPEDLARGLARDEVGELARHLDALHDRTRAFIAREQALTADASHELRTPLTVLGVACERLRAGAPDDLQPLVQSMQVSVWQLQETVELLLAAARETPTGPSSTPSQPLLPVVERLILAHAPLLDRQGIAVEIDVAPGLTRPWPAALTHLLLSNLLANAIAHSQAACVRITADAERLSVCNASSPPPASLLGSDVAGRSRGVKGATSTGDGLGLSIVRRLAERHGLALDLSHDDGRTCATLRAAAFAAASHPET